MLTICLLLGACAGRSGDTATGASDAEPTAQHGIDSSDPIPTRAASSTQQTQWDPTPSQTATSAPSDASSPDPNPTATLAVSPWPEDPAEIDPANPAQWTVQVIAVAPHDPTAFTQGLEIHDDLLLESTGLYGQSSIRIVDPASGAVISERALDSDLFGEGLTRIDNMVVQLTWREGTLLRWRLPDLDPLASLSYSGEGWGVCAAGDTVITTDGSAQAYHRNPATWEVINTVNVTLQGRAVSNLNELECIGDYVVANIWGSNDLVVFDPSNGVVVAVVDASPLSDIAGRPNNPQAVLNGVADMGDGTLLLTGKLWPSTVVVGLVTRRSDSGRSDSRQTAGDSFLAPPTPNTHHR